MVQANAVGPAQKGLYRCSDQNLYITPIVH